ncbi:MAG: class I SAM-dependent methyltransferase [bacterium]|nr:class I SAM-dependent methyltransferase [bacterium]
MNINDSLANIGQAAKRCHMCRDKNLQPVLDLGFHPPSDAFLRPEHLSIPEVRYPLRLVSCQACGLLQIDYLVKPEILYQRDYPYESSTTATGRAHYHKMAAEICEQFSLPEKSLAIDIGSNVGVLLEGFQKKGMNILGVDPAETAGRKAIANGIPTIIDFFGEKLAYKIVKKYGKARIITGTNVFAHILDLDGVVRGMKVLLAPKGVISIEAPYAVDLVKNLEYDTIYHEHIGYLSVRPMARYFKRFGLELFDVKKSKIHGGTLRYYVGRKGAYKVSPAIAEHIKLEEKFGLYSLKELRKFATKVGEQRLALVELLGKLKKEGKTVVGISAPAKGNTLLNYCNLDGLYLDFLTEKTQIKIGRHSPGMHIPVRSDQEVLDVKPDYALILAWNFAEEIMKNLSEFKKAGGKFIIPIPKPKII